jgi:transglutaminase-like putative cysteine protease
MYDIRQFKPALYILLALGISGFALAANAPGMWLLAMVALGLNAWLVKSGRFRPMPRLVANIITLLAFVYVAMQVQQLGPRSVLVIGQFLVLLQLIKLYEQRANRDYAQLIVLSLLLMVAAAINTASLVFGLMFIAYLFLSLYCCLLFHLKVESDQARSAIAIPNEPLNPAILRQDQRYLSRSMRRLTALVSAVAIVMAVVVFLLFPRGTGAGLLSPIQFRQSQTLTGFSEQVDFHRVARITQNEEVVAHVRLFRNDVAVKGDAPLLLRGVTLDTYSGSGIADPPAPAWRWMRTQPDPIPEEVRGKTPHVYFPPSAERWRQQISLEPTGTPVLFAIAGIESFMPDRTMSVMFTRSDSVLRSADRIEHKLVYEVVSSGMLADRSSWRDLRTYLPYTGQGRRGSRIDPQIAEYARRPEVSGSNAAGPLAAQRGEPGTSSPLDADIADNIAKHLRSTFAYTLDLTDAGRDPGKDPLTAFLYDMKRGHCEYFAGAMTLMCQSLGIPARMVVGFRCDEYNGTPGAQYYIVRQSHAHAWVEVRMPDNTWRTYDPTSGRDPRDRRNAGLWTRIKHAFDFLEYTWAANVVAYDRDSRDNVLASVDRQLINTAANSRMVFGNFHQHLYDAGLWLATRFVGPFIALMVIAMVGAIGWFLLEKWRLRKRALRIGLEGLPEREQLLLARQLGFYDDLLRLLERRHITRPRHLTPLEFSDSLSFLPSEVYGTVRRLTELFYRIRFGGARLSPARRHRLDRVIERLEQAMTRPL